MGDVRNEDTPSCSSKNQNESWHDVLHEYGLSSTVHGVPIISRSINIAKKLFWLLILISATIFWIYNTYTLAARFNQTPISTSIKYEEVPFSFPDVTLCVNGLGMMETEISFISDLPENQLKMENGYSIYPEDYLMAFRSIWASILKGRSSEGDAEVLASSTMHAIGGNKLPWRRRETDLLLCKYAGEQCDFRDFQEIYLPNHGGRCYSFKPGKTTRKNLTRSIKQVSDGLTLVIYVVDSNKAVNSFESARFVPGAKIAVHPKDTAPDMVSAALAPLQSHLELALDQTQTIRDPRAKRGCLKKKDTEAIPVVQRVAGRGRSGADHEIQWYTNTGNLCSEIQFQKRLAARCGCISETRFMTLSQYTTYPLCYQMSSNVSMGIVEYDFGVERFKINNATIDIKKLNRSHFEEQTFIRTSSCYESNLESISALLNDAEDCPQLCDHLSYQLNPLMVYRPKKGYAVVKFDYLMERLFKESMVNCANTTGCMVDKMETMLTGNKMKRFTLAVVQIYPASALGKQITETLGYPAANFVSDLGGSLGLYIGASLITIAELVEFAIRLVAKKCKKTE